MILAASFLQPSPELFVSVWSCIVCGCMCPCVLMLVYAQFRDHLKSPSQLQALWMEMKSAWSSPDGKVWSGRTTKYQRKDCASVTGYLALLSLCHCPDRYCCRFHQKDKTKQSTHDSTIHTTEFCRSHLSNNTLLRCPLIPSKAHTPAYYIQQNFAGAI